MFGKIDEAEAILARAVELAPDHAQAHYNLGLACLQQGQLSRARLHVAQAEALGVAPSAEVAEALDLGK
jgi:Flp pilus assembly protein TadD